MPVAVAAAVAAAVVGKRLQVAGQKPNSGWPDRLLGGMGRQAKSLLPRTAGEGQGAAGASTNLWQRTMTFMMPMVTSGLA